MNSISHIHLITTGGTIAGVGNPGEDSGYSSGVLSAEDILHSLPPLPDNLELEVTDLFNKNSDDITSADWLTLLNLINSETVENRTDSFIITHGTDTMEETAFFLSLTVNPKSSVILTGAMKPSTSDNPDGPVNLFNALKLASNPEGIDAGVYIFMNGQIYPALSAEKKQTSGVDAFEPFVSVNGPKTKWFEHFDCSSHFYLNDCSSLPPVSIVYFYTDADPEILEFAAKKSKGLVIAGAGAGEFSLKWAEAIKKLSIPVVISTRVDSGFVPDELVYCSNVIGAGDLSPQKAAILLRLCLSQK